MALETEALSISSVLKMIKITNQNLPFTYLYSYFYILPSVKIRFAQEKFKLFPQMTCSIQECHASSSRHKSEKPAK